MIKSFLSLTFSHCLADVVEWNSSQSAKIVSFGGRERPIEFVLVSENRELERTLDNVTVRTKFKSLFLSRVTRPAVVQRTFTSSRDRSRSRLSHMEIMSQRFILSQRKSSQQSAKETTYDCPICMTTKTRQLLQLPCDHNVCSIMLKEESFRLISEHVRLSSSYVYHVFTWSAPIRHWLVHFVVVVYHRGSVAILIIPNWSFDENQLSYVRRNDQRKKPNDVTTHPSRNLQVCFETFEERMPISGLSLVDKRGDINADWLLAKKIHYEQIEEVIISPFLRDSRERWRLLSFSSFDTPMVG